MGFYQHMGGYGILTAVDPNFESQIMNLLCNTRDTIGELGWVWNEAICVLVAGVLDAPAVINLEGLVIRAIFI